MKYKLEFAKRLRWIIVTVMQISQAEFARMVGATRSQINLYLKAKTYPTNEVFQKFAEIGISPEFLEYGINPFHTKTDEGEKLRQLFYQNKMNITVEKADTSDIKNKLERLENFVREKFPDYNHYNKE